MVDMGFVIVSSIVVVVHQGFHRVAMLPRARRSGVGLVGPFARRQGSRARSVTSLHHMSLSRSRQRKFH